jgi:GTPase SAR1 family protein
MIKMNKSGRKRVTIVVGMAGAGKSSVVHSIKSLCDHKKDSVYVVNLDPAVKALPYEPNIDIRDTIDYDGIRKKYNLGPNGAILTACNLFATRFDQVVSLCALRAKDVDQILIDTPGQLEIFTWSASGSIICESLASSFEVKLLFVVDTPRARDAQVFMSNVLQCLSMMYKMQVPVVMAFNKTDVVSHQFANDWMQRPEKLCSALEEASTYASELSRSLVTTISEFYLKLQSVGISAATAEGLESLLNALTI